MAYFPHNLLPEFQKLKADSFQNALSSGSYQSPPKDFSAAINPYQDLGSLMATMSALNAQMSLQQMAFQQPEQAMINELMLQNEILQLKVRTLTAEKEALAEKLEIMQEKLRKITDTKVMIAEETSGKKKRFRRVAKDIARDFSCPVAGCEKSYGSEGSLHQHIRLKHPSFDLVQWNESIGGAKKLKPTSVLMSGKSDLGQNTSEPLSENTPKSE